MCIVGCQRDAKCKRNGGFKRWKVENSWGGESGRKGFITMSDSWFEDNVVSAALPVAMRRRHASSGATVWLRPFETVL